MDTANRYFQKRLARLRKLGPSQREAQAKLQLRLWKDEALLRAKSLRARMVWDLIRDPKNQDVIRVLDPLGELELEKDLRQICIQAVASMGKKHLASASRPAADRDRLNRRNASP